MNDEALPRVLCVDDEPNLLAGLERSLFGLFEVVTADGGEAALALMDDEPAFAVIMSDMRMPGMNGATFLARARDRAPDSVRILLTGQADTESAIAAINQGAIFRFLCKPCPSEVLVPTLEQAVRQYRATLLERELLQTTLTGAVRTLTEVLGMVAPWATQRTASAQSLVRQALARLQWHDGWAVQVAAALSHIGCVAVPADVLQRALAGRELSAQEQALFAAHPQVAQRLLAGIPRLQQVADIVRYQDEAPPNDAAAEVVRGAHLLRAALPLAQALPQEGSMERAIERLRAIDPPIGGDIIDALWHARPDTGCQRRSARARDLVAGWRIEEDVRTSRGVMVLKAGSELSVTAILTLRNLAKAGAIEEPLLVSAAAGEAPLPQAT